MEQALLDSSKYKIHSLSVDSRFADQYNCGTADFTIRLSAPCKNIQRVAISSVELPQVEYLFSSAHGNLHYTITVGATTYGVDINPGNYCAADLVAELQASIRAATGDPTYTVTYSTITGLVTIANPTTAFSFSGVSDNTTIAARPSYWGLGYYLGFRSKDALPSSLVGGVQKLTSATIIDTQPTPYYLLQVYYPELMEAITHRVEKGGAVPAFAKLVLRDNFYTLQFVNNGDLMRKELTALAPVNISLMRFRLVDPYGCTVDMRDVHWSLTVELYEVVNSRTYSHLGMTYER